MTGLPPVSKYYPSLGTLKCGDLTLFLFDLLGLIKRWPDYHVPYNNLACIFWGSGDFDNAVKFFENALRLSQSEQSVVIGYGNMLLSYKKYARAKELFEGYLKTKPDDTEIRSMLQHAESVLEKVKSLTQVVEKLKD